MMELKKMPLVVGCLGCDFRTNDPKQIDNFRANGCPDCANKRRNEINKEMMEDFSNVIAKHFPHFDYRNIENQTWSFLVLFTEELIYQLGKETK